MEHLKACFGPRTLLYYGYYMVVVALCSTMGTMVVVALNSTMGTMVVVLTLLLLLLHFTMGTMVVVADFAVVVVVAGDQLYYLQFV